MEHEPVVPDYSGACLANLMPAVAGARRPDWFPGCARDGGPIVLVVVDGLGWNQFEARRSLMPELAAMEGGPIDSVAPTTTATALTSITTGLSPAEHGVIGYRMQVDEGVLNVLRWAVDGDDARNTVPPEDLQGVEPFLGLRPPVVTKAEFDTTGFTRAHLRHARLHGWRTPSGIVVEVRRLVDAGEQLVYAYYDGVDKIAHVEGLADHYDAEIGFVDMLLGRLLDALPAEVSVVVTADHGQVDVGSNTRALSADVESVLSGQSGEGRFRWLHARPGASAELLAAATEMAGHEAWVVGREQVLDERWFGPVVTSPLRRLGDVALVPHAPVAYLDPADTGPFQLIGRHGSLTADEVLVPLLGARGRR